MKFYWERETSTGVCSLGAVPGSYDSHPLISNLLIDYIPRLVGNPRISVAFTLAFSSSISGEIEFPSKVGPELAAGVQRLLEPTAVSVTPIDLEPSQFTYGENVFVLNYASDTQPEVTWAGFDSPRCIGLNLTDMSDSFSAQYRNEVLSVPTNAGLFATMNNLGQFSHEPFIAVAVMLSEDYDVGTIRLPKGTLLDENLRRVGMLLQTCGMNLELQP
ncbi:hypothetical protein [Arthrobacter sp. 260]|uniref:hypothetical protein n=1 Tax=Arthrobacter sp. 260 TaxID=2735314 RepID=UPI001491280F|nr:hypothetical protein [Arthrobacter sp. 260]NOJ60389.1 hypothetical protein [Arthrobacter sp. 260]